MDGNYNLNIVRVDDTSALSDFYCGVKPMDDFIHDPVNGLEKFVKLRLSNLWIVFEGEMAVAFFALSKDALILNNEDILRIKDNKDNVAIPSDDEGLFWSRERYPALEIDYLAVREEKRNASGMHLGTCLIDAIEVQAANDIISATMFLTVDAFDTKEYSAVGFYKKCGFEFSDVAQKRYDYDSIYGDTSDTRRMYKLIIPVKE